MKMEERNKDSTQSTNDAQYADFATGEGRRSSFVPSTVSHTSIQSATSNENISYQPSRNGSTPFLIDSYAKNEPLPSKSTKSVTSTNPRTARLQASVAKLQSQIEEKTQELERCCQQLASSKTQDPSTRNDQEQTLNDQEGREKSERMEGSTDQNTILSQAQSVVTRHIKLLHRYNEIKDVGLGLLGLIAEMEGRRLKDVMADRGLSEKD